MLSCGHEAASETPNDETTAPPGVAKALMMDTMRCPVEGKQVTQSDVNHDGRSDLVTVFERDGTTLSCRQADFNFDGQVDAYFHYGPAGAIEREQFDLDFDGFLDLGRLYNENGEVSVDEEDTDRDGFIDAWRRYEKGRLVRIESDRDRDGQPDMFTHFVAGRIDRIGYDTNGDGIVDEWDHDAARRSREADQTRRASRRDAEQAEAAQVGSDEEPSPSEKTEERAKSDDSESG